MLEEWDYHEGPDWAAYEKGWKAGWVKGCVAADTKIQGERSKKDPDYAWEDGPCVRVEYAPGPEEDLFSNVPTYPPDSPKFEGQDDGLYAGCLDAYNHFFEEKELDELDPWHLCPVEKP